MMSLSLGTMMGIQNPTRHEKYVIEECIKILRFRRYSIGYSYPMNPSEKNHDITIDNIVKDLKKILARSTREDKTMFAICKPIKSARSY